jgi:hypothetical protein
MIDARKKFKEGFIMLNRGFQFAELKYPLQKFTILWAYSEQPVIERSLSKEAIEEIETIQNTSSPFGFWTSTDRDDFLQKKIDNVLNAEKSYNKLHIGDIVQTYVDGALCRFFPNEYSIIDATKLFEIMQEDGYHTICSPALEKIPDFLKNVHYIKSRGVDDETARRWVTLGYKDLVIYKPYYQLLELFCRPMEIISNDEFYINKEGIDFTELNEIQKEIVDKKHNDLVKSFTVLEK